MDTGYSWDSTVDHLDTDDSEEPQDTADTGPEDTGRWSGRSPDTGEGTGVALDTGPADTGPREGGRFEAGDTALATQLASGEAGADDGGER